MAEFKKISEVEVVEAPSENDTLLLVSEGEVKQVPVSKIGGGGYVLKLTEDNYAYIEYNHHYVDNYDEIYDVLTSGGAVRIDWEFVYGYPYAEIVCSYELSSNGLYLESWDGSLYLPNGSHNLPEEPES